MDEEIRMTESRNRDNVQAKGNGQTEKIEIKKFSEPPLSGLSVRLANSPPENRIVGVKD